MSTLYNIIQDVKPNAILTMYTEVNQIVRDAVKGTNFDNQQCTISNVHAF